MIVVCFEDIFFAGCSLVMVEFWWSVATKEVSSVGVEVTFLDYVASSTQGTKWGLGGTCVFVGVDFKETLPTNSILEEAKRNTHTERRLLVEPQEHK